MDLEARHGGNREISLQRTARSGKGRLRTEFLTRKIKLPSSEIGNALLLKVLRMLISYLTVVKHQP